MAKNAQGVEVDENGVPINPAPVFNDSTSAYNKFKATQTPTTDVAAANKATNLLGNYGNVSYSAQNPQSYIPQDTLAQLGKVTGGLSNYTPEKINVSKVETMPAEYYQTQVQELSQPITSQYEKARATSRGDQAARGTLYDSEGYKDIGELDKSYLEKLGDITSRVQLKRMENENANAQDYATRSDTEALNRRSMGLEGLTSGGNLLSGVASMYGDLGSKESDRAITTALQNKGLDANTINSLLGYGADRYGTEANLFGDIYGADTDFNKYLLEDQTTREQNRKQNILDMLGLPGYGETDQQGVYEGLSGELGYDMKKGTGTEGNPSPISIDQAPMLGLPSNTTVGGTARGNDGGIYMRQNDGGWRRLK